MTTVPTPSLVAGELSGRTANQCLQRWTRGISEAFGKTRKRKWTAEEDEVGRSGGYGIVFVSFHMTVTCPAVVGEGCVFPWPGLGQGGQDGEDAERPPVP